MSTPTFYYPTGLSGQDLINYLTELVNDLQNLLAMLDEKNIHHLNYIPLTRDGSIGNATPAAGWVRAISSSAVTALQYYDTTWKTLMNFSTAYQTNSTGEHFHNFSIPQHTHSFSGTASTATGAFSGVTGLDGAFDGNTTTAGLHSHVLITT